MTSATTRKAGHTRRTSEPHAKNHFWVFASPAPREAPRVVSGGVDPAPESAGPTGRSRSSQLARGGSRGQLELLRAPRCHRPTFFRSWKPREPTDRPRPLLKPAARTAMALEEAGGTFRLQEARRKCHSLRTVHPIPTRGQVSSRTRLFHEPELPALTVGQLRCPRRLTPGDQLATDPFRGDPRRP